MKTGDLVVFQRVEGDSESVLRKNPERALARKKKRAT
jgi:hypothetical protein